MADDMLSALQTAMTSVSKDWRKAKVAAGKQEKVRERDLERMRQYRYRPPSIKDAAEAVMEEAYLKASANGTLPANARMIMYAARPLVLEKTGGECWKNSSYFTQTLLPDYLEQFEPGWNVVYDARGHLLEPHGGTEVKLGTVDVRNYIYSWQSPGSSDLDVSGFIHERFPTAGPKNRYHFALFIEKEGFNELLEAARIGDRFDIAVMSTKGMSTTAARLLVEDLSSEGVTILVAHDFDKSGFAIAHTLGHDTRRYEFVEEPNVVDIGLRLADVQAMDLASEAVYYNGGRNPRWNLKENGASDEEVAFLVEGRHPGYGGNWYGKRVELNAMMADQFVEWIEKKLTDNGVTKLVPAPDVLDLAYKRATRMAAVKKAITTALKDIDKAKVDVPDDLAADIAERIAGTAYSWDDALWDIAAEEP